MAGGGLEVWEIGNIVYVKGVLGIVGLELWDKGGAHGHKRDRFAVVGQNDGFSGMRQMQYPIDCYLLMGLIDLCNNRAMLINKLRIDAQETGIEHSCLFFSTTDDACE